MAVDNRVDLVDLFRFDAGPPRHGRTSWLVDRVRAAIAGGSVAPGTRLPASRVLAEELSMSRGTVVEAYRRLLDEGLLSTNRGGGTVVAARLHTSGDSPSSPAEPTERTEPEAVNASAGMPDLSAFPRAAWLRAQRRVLATATGRELGYTDPQGAPALRGAIAGWLARTRGLRVDPGRVVVTAGVTGALSLLAQVMREHGMSGCAVEDPGADGNRRILEHWLTAVEPVGVDGHGLVVDALARTSARAVLVTPAHQYPTGVVLSPQRRRDLIAWADKVDGLVIEDDYDAEYRYDRAPVRAMHAIAPERVVHVSSLSKILAPALRIGWMLAPAALHDDLVRQRWATDLGSPTLTQLTLAELIGSGTLERHLRTLRGRHRHRRDAAVGAIRRWMPGCPIDGVAAGLHLVVRLPEHIDDTEFADRARAVGIAVDPLARHRFRPGPPGLIIGYGPHAPAQLEQTIRTLGEILNARSATAGRRRAHPPGR